MPKNTHYIVAIILIVLFVNIASLYFGKKDTGIPKDTSVVSTSTEMSNSTTTATKQTPVATKPTVPSSGNIKGFYSYANAVQKFSIQYPSYVQPLTSFATFHEIGNNWRLYASPANQGKNIVSFSLYNIDQGIYSTGRQTYPLYFTSEVRVGVSPNIKECYTKDAGYTNQTVTDVIINGVTFKKFSTSDAGMQKYTQAESYRTIHNNSCYVIEQIRSGSSYRDEKMTTGKTDAELLAYYNLGEKVVRTFRFTK